MIFWIGLAVLAVAVLYMAVSAWFEAGFVEALIKASAMALFGSIVGCVLVLGAGFLAKAIWDPAPTSQTISKTTFDLRATSTVSSVKGSFFLGSGTINDQRVFSFLYKEDKWTRSDQVPARSSRVAEDATAETAWMQQVVTDNHYSWWLPWVVSTDVEYFFHVPKDSVVESYEISAN